MHEIEMQTMSAEFLRCWQDAGIHLDRQVEGGIQSWLRAHPYPPFLEHLSFRLGNQLFFVRVEDIDRKIRGPGGMQGLFAVSEGMHGQPCILPMKKRILSKGWAAVHREWGLIDAKTGRPIDPVRMVTDEKIEMTRWEIHDMAVQVVRQDLERRGYQLMSWQSNPDVDPSLWFVGDTGGPEWVVVRAVVHPRQTATLPKNLADIAANVSRESSTGHFAPVSISSDSDPSFPLWRGYGMYVGYEGLKKVMGDGGV